VEAVVGTITTGTFRSFAAPFEVSSVFPSAHSDHDIGCIPASQVADAGDFPVRTLPTKLYDYRVKAGTVQAILDTLSHQPRHSPISQKERFCAKGGDIFREPVDHSASLRVPPGTDESFEHIHSPLHPGYPACGYLFFGSRRFSLQSPDPDRNRLQL
jgi:hypothetical protein